jgi:peptidyl-prolyl cis-trans isomerase B (cyclophilin B)
MIQPRAEEDRSVTRKDRRRQLARQRYERQQQRAQRARRARRNRAVGVVAGLVVVAMGGTGLAFAFAGESGDNTQAAVSPAAASSATPAATPTIRPGECGYLPNREQGVKDVGTPPVKPRYKSTVSATVKTNLGAIVMDLDGAKAACTVNSFAYLADKNFFDRTQCHRLVTEGIKVLQCGDPTGTGSGGPAYKYGEENLPIPKQGGQTATYAKGVLAMANAGPGTNGSQFFMVYGDSELPPNYTVFGKITEGMDIVESVAEEGVKAGGSGGTGDGQPQKAVTIQDVTITKK